MQATANTLIGRTNNQLQAIGLQSPVWGGELPSIGGYHDDRIPM